MGKNKENAVSAGITEKQAKRNLWFFPLGTFGRDMIYNLFTNFILVYVLFTHNLTPAQLMAITGIMIGARVFDALNDPLMGNIIERTRTRWGKYKPWLVIGILSTSIVVYLAFNVRLEGWAFIWFFGIIYFAYSIAYTMHDISYWGMIPSLSKEGSTRDKLTAMTNLAAGVGGGLAGLFIPMLTTGSGAIGGNAQTAYGVVALIFCILAPLFLCFTIFGVREDRSYMDTTPPPVSFKKIISTITGNDQLSWMCLIFLLHQIGADLIVGGIGSTYIYFTYGYKGGLYSLFSTIRIQRRPLLAVLKDRPLGLGNTADRISVAVFKMEQKETDEGFRTDHDSRLCNDARSGTLHASHDAVLLDHHSRLHAGPARNELLLRDHDAFDHQYR